MLVVGRGGGKDGGGTCLEMQDDVPDKIKNNRRDAVGNARNVDARQLHLRGKQRDAGCSQIFF